MINIKVSYIKILIVLVTLLTLSTLNMLIFRFDNIYILSLSLVLFLIVIKFTVGYEKDRNRFKKDALMNIFIFVMVYHIFTFVAGIFIGFTRTVYDLSFLNIVRNIVPVIIMIITMEILRYAINKKIDKNKWLLLLSTITFVTIDICFQVMLFRYNGVDAWLTVTALAIIPSITKNILLGYTVINFGIYPNILYRFLMELPIFLLPIFPNFNEYMNAIFAFVLPLVILWFMYKDIVKKRLKEKKGEESSLSKHWVSKIVSTVLILVTLFTIGLTSGIFSYFSLSIGSGSMEPNINIGDVVVVEKIEENEVSKLVVGDILVYNMEDVIIVHRIEEINENNDVYSFITKGDNNKSVDEWVVTPNLVVGKVVFTIPLVGYPTIWLNDLTYEGD